MKYDYDVAVIGAGSGWLTVALGLAGAGKKVALIEKGLIWGDCTNFGCVPSKALIDISKDNSPFEKGSTWGTKGRDLKWDFKSAMQEVRNRRKIIQDEETVEKIESYGLKVFQWLARFKNYHTLNIIASKNCQITAKKIVIASWSRAKKIELPGVQSEDILTNEEIFEQTDNIKNLVIIWGGYIGCELAESIAELWVTVHLVQRNKDLVPHEEKESRDLLRKIFEAKGISVHTWMTFKSAKWNIITLENTDGTQTQEIQYDKVLIALWRQPNTEKLDLEKADIVYSEKWIPVNKYNITNKKHIFAIGDCVENNPQFTHLANNEGRGVIRNILVPVFKKSVRNRVLPAALYTHLEVARVWKTKKELLKKYESNDIITKKINFSANDRSKLTHDDTGFIIMHCKRVSWKILWATIFWKNAGEMISQISIAMDNKISAYKLSKTIQPYPTKSDLIKRVTDGFVVETISNLKREIQYWLYFNILQISTAFIWITVISWFIWYKNSTGQSIEQMALGFYNFVSGNPWGPILYILAYAVRPIVLFPATLMTFMSWALFWLPLGMLFTLIWETLSACFAYFLGRVFGKKLLDEDAGWIVTSLKCKVNSNPFMSVLMARFLFFPFDLTNYACWFLKVHFPSYVWATALGIIPWMTVFILAGSAFYNQELTSFSDALTNVDTKYLVYAAVLFVITIVFAKILKRLQK